MIEPTIFIVSSERALPLVTQLKAQLERTKRFSLIWPWKDVVPPGRTITEILSIYAPRSDFAIVLLTCDDLIIMDGHAALASGGLSASVFGGWAHLLHRFLRRDSVNEDGGVTVGRAKAVFTARDNCIYEAGIFTGTFGVNYRRCFLVCSKGIGRIPTDLEALQQIRFDEPDLDDTMACEEEMKRVASQILQWANDGCIDRHRTAQVLTGDELIELEQVGKNIREGEEVVLVCAREPLERDHKFAKRVMRNMERRVIYEYYFHGNLARVSRVWDMIQMLSLASLIPDDVKMDPGGAEALERLEMIEKDPEDRKKVVNNIKIIQQRLKIYFLPRVAGIELCVHNANNPQHARSYLRFDNQREEFIEWHAEVAWRVMDVVKDVRNHCKGDPKGRIFCSTEGLEEMFHAKLEEPVREKSDSSYFPRGEIKQMMWQICFGDAGEIAKFC